MHEARVTSQNIFLKKFDYSPRMRKPWYLQAAGVFLCPLRSMSNEHSSLPQTLAVLYSITKHQFFLLVFLPIFLFLSWCCALHSSQLYADELYLCVTHTKTNHQRLFMCIICFYFSNNNSKIYIRVNKSNSSWFFVCGVARLEMKPSHWVRNHQTRYGKYVCTRNRTYETDSWKKTKIKKQQRHDKQRTNENKQRKKNSAYTHSK